MQSQENRFFCRSALVRSVSSARISFMEPPTKRPIIDTRTCGTNPPLVSGPGVVSDDDVTLSLNDSRMSISLGGSQQSKHMFVVVYDKKLGCRWYNTETGEIGGKWGAAGTASTNDRFLIRHAYLSRNGRYVRILVNW